MPYPELLRIVCPKCKVECLVYEEQIGKELVCLNCSHVLIVNIVINSPNRPDPRHIC